MAERLSNQAQLCGVRRTHTYLMQSERGEGERRKGEPRKRLQHQQNCYLSF